MTQKDAEIRWENPAINICHQFRGTSPKPGAWCNIEIRGKTVRVKLIEMVFSPHTGECCEILSYDEDGITVACSKDSVKLKKLQIEGKRALSVSEFIKGYSLKDISFKSEVCSNEV